MANFLGPDPLQSTFFIPGSNTPGNGVQLFIYLAGSTTKTTVYKTISGTAHTNPIILDSGGNLPGQSQLWIPAGVTIKAVYAPSNDSDPPSSPYLTLDNISGINDVSATASQWVTGPTPTFVSPTSFTVVGDQTADAHIGRRIQTQNTGGTVYSTISSSVFTSTTAIGVRNDAPGALDAGLSALNYGLLTAIDPSVPLLTDTYPDVMNATDKSKLHRLDLSAVPSSTTIVEQVPFYSYKPQTQVRASSGVTAASTTNVSSIAGDWTDLNGTTAINQFTMFDGQTFSLRATTTTPINNSSTLVVIGNANMTTVAGDWITLKGSSSQVYMQALQRFTSTAANGMVRLETGTGIATSSINIPMQQYSSFPNKTLKVRSFWPVNNSAGLYVRFSDTNGASFDAGSNYRYAERGLGSGGGSGDLSTSVASQIEMSGSIGVGNTAAGGIEGTIDMFDTNATTMHQRITFAMAVTNGSQLVEVNGAGVHVSTGVLNGIQLLFSAGNISSGSYDLYGQV